MKNVNRGFFFFVFFIVLLGWGLTGAYAAPLNDNFDAATPLWA